ncbi:MAG: hypothetical protein UMV23_07060 [Halanaerobium sp.]|nr:hypothetical protein [Halanaerobium sp.]
MNNTGGDVTGNLDRLEYAALPDDLMSKIRATEKEISDSIGKKIYLMAVTNKEAGHSWSRGYKILGK